MFRTPKLFFVLCILLMLVLAACSSAVVEAPAAEQEAPAEDEEAASEGGEAALRITGDVANEQSWTEDEVKGMTSIDVESTNSKDETETYSGVLFADLLEIAQPNDSATTVVFVADDGYTAEIALNELMACSDCIASFRSKGGFSSVMPGYPASLQVKGVIEIQVK